MTTREFLSHFKDFAIQTFDDNVNGEKDHSLSRVGKPSSFTAEEIKDLNARGAGIFFTVNRFPSGSRKQSECTGVNAWYTECDTLDLETQWANLEASPLPPNFIVQSKKSYHAYWLAKDATKENFQTIQNGLAKHFQGDPTMKDISRVLRVPGFCHMKDREHPHLVRIVSEGSTLPYSEAEMLERFKYAPPTLKIAPTQKSDFWETIGNLDSKMVLERLSGGSMVNGELITFSKRNPDGEYILVNGKQCDGWLDKENMIGSGKRGGPTWIQWLTYYGKDKKDIANWAKENLADLIPEELKNIDGMPIKVQSMESIITELEAEYKKPQSTLTWGMSYLDSQLPILEPARLIVIFGQQGSGKSLFCTWVARQNASVNKNVCFLSLEMATNDIAKSYALRREGISKDQYKKKQYDPGIFKKYLPELDGIKFIGIDEGAVYDCKKIAQIIKKEEPSILFIDNLNKIVGSGSELEVSQEVTNTLLRLTRSTGVPIVLIHHANKQTNEKMKGTANLRGLSGMRGSNKTNDDADIVLEISRPVVDYTSMQKDNVTNIACYKDRAFGTRSLSTIQFEKGNFVDRDSIIHKFAEEFGGKVID